MLYRCIQIDRELTLLNADANVEPVIRNGVINVE